MAVPYNKITTGNPELNQVQTEIARSFEAVPEAVTDADGITRVQTASGTKLYKVKDADKYVVGDTSQYPLTVSLPSPRNKRVILVICAGINDVTVQRADGKPFGNGAATQLEQFKSALFIADGTDWSAVA